MTDKVIKSDAEWRAQLDPLTYKVTREKGTERPGAHPGFPKGPGTYLCVCCGAPLFDAETKYESGSGWPSFYDVMAPDAVETKTDFRLRLPRTEIHCANCGAHLGHVFSDGPRPTGQRYCTNGTVLDFRPEETGGD